MSKINLVKLFLVFVISLIASNDLLAAEDDMKVASYGIGYDTGTKVKSSANLVDYKTFVEGLKDYLAKKEPKYSQEKIAQAAQEVNKIVSEKLGDKAQSVTPEMIAGIELPADLKDVLSYGSGFMYGVQLSEGAEIIDSDSIVLGFTDSVEGKESKYTPDQLKQAMTKLEAIFEQKMNEKMNAIAQPNIEAGKKFMEEYVKQDGVKVTPEGIAYKSLKVGTGEQPKPTDTVKVHYVGKLIDGTEFDSSIKRGKPAEFNIQQVVDGWKIIVPQMKVGDKWEIVIPYNLAYGLSGQPPIKPGDTLIFELELLGVK